MAIKFDLFENPVEGGSLRAEVACKSDYQRRGDHP